ncbi:MAG: hypothetical protein HYT40_03455 [Candidatus Sungbacteria bacterium]|uniref:Uncharacterized protein n=1 Tax=Candidatus Sungiibacteriota bacterium TaxID=2750080 RepID=A0A931SDP1_9BACT|nr:hypothetical protein [Candidatus Sungbacteria bacterium]
MPLVFVSRSEKVDDEILKKVMSEIPGIVARRLDVPQHPLARLVPGDIEVKLLGSPFDIGHFDLEVYVFAPKFEARIQNGQLRSDTMSQDLAEIMPSGMTGFVWPVLVDAFFSTFVGVRKKTLRAMLLESNPEVRLEIERDLRRADIVAYVEQTPEDLDQVMEIVRAIQPHVVIMGWHRFGPRFLNPLKEHGCQVWIYTADPEKEVREGGGGKADRIIDKFSKVKLADLLKAV